MKMLQMSDGAVAKNCRVRNYVALYIMIIASGLAIQNFKGFGTRKTFGARTIC